MNLQTPLIRDFGFFDYQKKWLADESRFKIGLWARQTGKDFTAAAEAVVDCLVHPATTWLVLAAGERQALESIEKAKDWARALDFAVADYREKYQAGKGTLLKSAEIKWSNGSRYLALPAKPETIRGYSANLILTEFAFHDDPDALWRAIYPSISNPLRGGVKKLRIISTPNGLRNKFADLWHHASDYTKHTTDIHQAVASGLDLDVEKLRAGLNDPDAWAQEYECRFLDTTSVLLPYELIQSCESPLATESCTPLDLSSAGVENNRGRELYVGIDFGRKHHLTVCWVLERCPGSSDHNGGSQFVTREVLCLKDMPTPQQMEILRPRLRLARRATVDFTGPGVGLGDFLVHEFGEWNPGTHRAGKIELCQFTAQFKGELYPRLRTAFEKQEIQIPSSRDIREDLHAVHRVVSTTGVITYRAASTPDGHSDRSTALALALRAAARPLIHTAPARSISIPSRSASLSWARRR